MEYPLEYRKQLIQKMLKPGGLTAMEVSRETGIHPATLYRWIKHAKNDGMSTRKGKSPRNFTLEQKYEFLLEARRKTEEEFGLWLREKGLQSDHLEKWEQEVANALKRIAGAGSKDRETDQKIRSLEKELTRKEKALAEMSALLMLKKNFSVDLSSQ